VVEVGVVEVGVIDSQELSEHSTAVLLIDIQDRLCAAMPTEVVATLLRNTLVVLEAARRLALPVVLTEQYPSGLGPTVAALTPALDALAPGQLHRIVKTAFSAAATEEFAALASVVDRASWLLLGMETHVCVLQTARGLRRGGATVHALTDAVCSRSKANFRVGIEQLRALDVVISSTETAVFSLLRDASSPHFKALSKLIK
jgi:nicotinamidase-related amidase